MINYPDLDESQHCWLVISVGGGGIIMKTDGSKKEFLPAFDFLTRPNRRLLRARARCKIRLLRGSTAWTILPPATWSVPISRRITIPWNRSWTSCPSPIPRSIAGDLYLRASTRCANINKYVSIQASKNTHTQRGNSFIVPVTRLVPRNNGVQGWRRGWGKVSFAIEFRDPQVSPCQLWCQPRDSWRVYYKFIRFVIFSE